MRRLLIVFLGSFFWLPAFMEARIGQHYAVDVWQTQDGLPQNSVTAIAQTPDNYLWIGTEEGLIRYDGSQMTLFDTQSTPEFRHNFIQALLVARDGSLWIGSKGGGVLHYQSGEFQSYSTSNGLSSNVVYALAEGENDEIWIATLEGGINILRNGKFTQYTTKQGLSSDSVRAILRDRSGAVWAGTYKGLNRIHNGKIEKSFASSALRKELIRSIFQDRSGTIFVGTAQGLHRLEGTQEKHYTKAEGLASNSVLSVFEDRQGNLWVGTNGGGLHTFAGETLIPFSMSELSSNIILTIFQDREDNLWVGTNGGGLNRIRKKRISTLAAAQGLSGNVVLPIYQASNGDIWIGTAGNGINRVRDGKISSFTVEHGLGSNVILSISEDNQGKLWVGTAQGGLSSFHDNRFVTFTTKDGLINHTITAIQPDTVGGLWLGTDGDGVIRLKEGKFSALTSKSNLFGNIVTEIYRTRAGDMWIGTQDGGANLYKGGQFKRYSTAEGLPTNHIFVIHEDEDGSIWIGTANGGLVRLKNEKLFVFSRQNGLFDNLVLGILEDQEGYLWLSCNKGIFRVLKRELNDVADGKRDKVRSYSYGTSDGMNTQECNGGINPAGWKMQNGELWFPTMAGVAIVNPQIMKIDVNVPPVVIEKVIVDEDQNVPVQKPLILRPGTRRLEIHYTAPTFVAPEKLRFQYKLEGYDESWIEAGTRRIAYYTGIPNGKYSFRILACNADGTCKETRGPLQLQMLPRFYQRRSLQFLLLGILLLCARAIYVYRLKHLTIQKRELELKVADRTHEVTQQKQELSLANEQLSLTLKQLNEAREKLEIRVRERTEELSQAYEALRFSEEKYRELFEESKDTVFVASGEGKIVDINAAGVELFGYQSKEEMLNLDPKEDLYWNPEDREKYIRFIQEYGYVKDYELELKKKDGTKFVALETATAFQDADGNICFRGILRDMTALKELQQRVQHAEKIETIGRLAGGVAHDFNNVLMAITAYCELMEIRLSADSPLREPLHQTLRAAEHGAALTRQLLAFGRKQKLNPKVLDLRAVIDGIIPILRRLIGEHIQLETDTSDEPVWVKIDQYQIEQVVLNVALNSRDAISNTGKIQIEIGKTTLTKEDVRSLMDVNPGEYAFVNIEDNGNGMTEETLSHIFEPFYTTKEMGGGTGLGLATVYGIVKQSGGIIQVDSIPRKGTKFRIFFPTIVSDAVMESSPETPTRSHGFETILLVDDNVTARKALASLLEMHGYRVLQADDGQQAITVSEKYGTSIDLLITDVAMPNISGPESAKRIKSELQNLKVIFTSGYSGDSIPKESLADSSQQIFLQKPYSTAVLLQHIRRLLDETT
jgi:PAS domain S-box-containing protein